jgi:REP-associated tyrosine transposase
MGHPPRIPVWLRWEQSVIYFVTICVADRKRVLANEAAFKTFKNAAAKFRRWRVLAAILMPDHLHAVVAPNERDAQLGNCSAALKRWMRKELNASWHWQPGCFDRLLRSDESLHDKWLYLLENPVRAGLVKDWKDWPYRFEFNKGRQLQDAARLPASVASHRFGKRSACPTTHDSPLLQWQPERLP